jgi:acyl-CoA thioester hydrolase
MTGNQPVIPAGGRHRYGLRVYYEDTDAGGIVYHAGYLRFAERARTEALRDLGIPHAEMTEHFNLMFVVRQLTIDYVTPARLDDSLTVETSAEEVGGATVTLRQDVLRQDVLRQDVLRQNGLRRDGLRPAGLRPAGLRPAGLGRGGLCATLRVRLACVNAGEAKPGRMPPRWRSVLSALRDAGRPVS